MTSSTGHIVVTRPGGRYRDAGRAYRVEVDGQQVGTLRAGAQLDIPATPGPHSVQIRLDWTGSPKTMVLVSEQNTPRLVAQPAGTAFSALLRSLRPTKYIELIQA